MNTMAGDPGLTKGRVIFAIMLMLVLAGLSVLGTGLFVLSGWFGIHEAKITP